MLDKLNSGVENCLGKSQHQIYLWKSLRNQVFGERGRGQPRQSSTEFRQRKKTKKQQQQKKPIMFIPIWILPS